jgi:adenine-specific DNA-methyltransferase
MPTSSEFKLRLESNLRSFLNGDLTVNAAELFSTLGYESDKVLAIEPNTFEGFKKFLTKNGVKNFNETKAHVDEWVSIDFLFQLTDEEAGQRQGLFDSSKVDFSDARIESYIFFAIELEKAEYKRSDLAEITREINKVFPMPAMILFKHGESLTFSIIDRRLNKRDSTRDVLEKVTLIKDIRIQTPHRAHIEILSDLSLDNFEASNFVELHKAWQKTLDTKELNKKFFQELANWYFWAVDSVKFPDDEEKNVEVRNATSVIRLITRLMFVWFLKEKGLVSPKLFDEQYLKTILKFEDESTYYKAILQNLFFATLNSDMGKRKFIGESSGGRNTQHFVHNVFRYKKEFRQPDETLKELFDPIPFLNGGLFECLDKEIEVDGELKRIRVDGFSDHKKNAIYVPNDLFFVQEDYVDLSEVYDDARKSNVKVRGLLNLLNSYKFTITENTPIEEEIALDPELLGRVFENLLASYNPETKTTARKATGSFYTPREIVNYMVDESLIAYLKQKLQEETEGFGFIAIGESQTTMFGNEARIQQKLEIPLPSNRWQGKEEELESALRHLFSYTEDEHTFNETETEILIKAIDNCKILDPACGSGAFPMGILHRLVQLLSKLDKDNFKWRIWQKQKALMETEKAYEIGDVKERDERLTEINHIFEDNSDDYGRKLFLIENCIYGVDIQPVAIQIAKLRFFISLIVDQQAVATKVNLGVRPLPNLETKFVAANTLLGLQSGGLKPIGVSDLEKELKEIRAKHFSAKTRKTKEGYRERDKALRAKIASLLVAAGFPSTSANQIAEWNPYEQNTSANWFDSEYMYGIERGFDIVIGNPPYIPLESISLLDRENFREKYKEVERKYDTSALFILQGFRLLKPKGVLSYIAPITWQTGENYSKLRASILLNYGISFIINLPFNTFENAYVETSIYGLMKEKRDTYRICNFDKKEQNPSLANLDFKSISTTRLTPPNYKIVLDSALNSIMSRFKGEHFVPLGSVTKSTQGLSASRFPETPRNGVTVFPFLKRGNVYNYQLKVEETINTDLSDKKSLIAFYQAEEKLLIRRIVNRQDRLSVGFTDKRMVFKKDINPFIPTSERFPAKFLLGILASKFISFYYVRSSTIATKDDFRQTTLTELRSIPIPDATVEEKRVMSTLVEQIIEIKERNSDADTTKLEEEIDKLVYQLYGLTEEEVSYIQVS